MDKNESAIFSCIGLLIFVVVSVVGAALMNGWVLSIFWGWFVVPVFNVPQLSIPLAIGLSLTVGMLCGSKSIQNGEKKSTGEIVSQIIATAFLSPLFVLFVGWIVKSFM